MLHLHADLIHNHPRGQRADFLKHLKSVFSKRNTRFHYIYNHLGKPYNRRQFNGTVQLNNLSGLMLFIIKIILGDPWIFCGHPNQRSMLQQFPRIGRTRDTHSAASDAEINHLVELPCFLHNRILTHNSDIGRTILHIRRNIVRFGKEKLKLLFLIRKNQLPGRFLFHFFTGNADLLKDLQRLFSKTSFGKRYSYIFHAFSPCANISKKLAFVTFPEAASMTSTVSPPVRYRIPPI